MPDELFFSLLCAYQLQKEFEFIVLYRQLVLIFWLQLNLAKFVFMIDVMYVPDIAFVQALS